MFGQSGGGVGPWQGQNNMDPETLAQTLVNVAQNLLSSQAKQNLQPSLSHDKNTARLSPWANSGQQKNNQGSYSGQQLRDEQHAYDDHFTFAGHHRPQSSYNDCRRDAHSDYDERKSLPGRSTSQGSSCYENSNKPRSMVGLGLLGAPPDGDYRGNRDPSFVIGGEDNYDQAGWGEDCFHSNLGFNDASQGGDGGFGISENKFVEKVDRGSAGFETEKSKKNYRPKIKEEGCPPKYSMVDFEQLATKYFRCLMCNKDMWNSVSFVNHIKGNAHNKTVEDVAAKEASKVAEVRKQIAELVSKDISRSTKGAKSGKCNMCGVRMVKDLAAHRRTDYHQQLKKFIHPHCKMCDADFEDRSDWYYHKFSAEHLTKLEADRETLEYDPMSCEKLEKLINQLLKRNGNKATKDTQNNEKSNKLTGKNKMFKEMKAFADKQGVKLSPTKQHETNTCDDDVLIIEDEDNLGVEFIKQVTGLWCSLCKEFFGEGVPDSAKSQHCNSKKHLEKCKTVNKNQHVKASKRRNAAEIFSSPKKMK